MKKISLLLLSLVVIGSPVHAGKTKRKGGKSKKVEQRGPVVPTTTKDQACSPIGWGQEVVPYSAIRYGEYEFARQDVVEQHGRFDSMREHDPLALNALLSLSLREEDGVTPSDECSYCGLFGFETPKILGHYGLDTSLQPAQLYFLNKFVTRDPAGKVLVVKHPITQECRTTYLCVLEEYNAPWAITKFVWGTQAPGWRDRLVTPDHKILIENGYKRLLACEPEGLHIESDDVAATMKEANEEFRRALVNERDSRERFYRQRAADGRWEKKVHEVSDASLAILQQLNLLLPDGSMHCSVPRDLLPDAKIDVEQ